MPPTDEAALKLNRPRNRLNEVVASATVLSLVGTAVPAIMPVFVGMLVEQRGLSGATAGRISGIEYVGMTLGSLLFSLLLSRLPTVRTLRVAALAIVIGSILTDVSGSDALAIAGARFLAGCGGGVLIATGYAVLGTSKNPERAYAVLLTLSVVYSSVTTILLRQFGTTIRLGSIMDLMAVVSAAAIYLAKYIEIKSKSAALSSSASQPKRNVEAVGPLLGYFMFSVGMGALWSYFYLIGTSSGIAAPAVSLGLSTAFMVGAIGSLAGGFFLNYISDRVLLFVTFIGMELCTWGLLGVKTVSRYDMAVILYNFFAMGLTPILFWSISKSDETGRAAALASTLVSGAAAIGPLMAAQIVAHGGYGSVCLVALVVQSGTLFALLRTKAHK